MIIAAFVAVYLIWGSTYLAISVAVKDFPPMFLAGARFLLAGVLVYAWERWRGAAAPVGAQWRDAAVVGGLLLLLGNGTVTWAQQHVPSGSSALVIASVPIWMVVLGWAFGQVERPGPALLAGLVLGFAGIALLLKPGAGGMHPVGGVVLLGAAAAWAAGSLYARRSVATSSPMLTNGMQMLAGGLLLMLASLVTGESVSFASVTGRGAWVFAYLVVFGSLVGFSAYTYLLRRVSPAAASTYAYVNPLVAVFLGWALAGEVVGPRTLVAAAVIVGAVALVTASGAKGVRARRPERSTPWQPRATCSSPSSCRRTA